MTTRITVVLTNEELELIKKAGDFFYEFSIACENPRNGDDNGAGSIYKRIEEFLDRLEETSFTSENNL